MTDRLGVVQFLHPGRECTPVAMPLNPWPRTSQPHARKFLLAEADYLVPAACRGPVGFWGEWEGPSVVTPLTHARPPRPRFLHQPAYYEPASHAGLWDTDPFVFGPRFLYNGCQQYTCHEKPSGPVATVMRALAPGSLILFGSHLDGAFILDTVFVVESYRDYWRGDVEAVRDLVPPEYLHLSILTQAAIEATVTSFRLYLGRPFQRTGMFSFVPCSPNGSFARPVIAVPSVITPSLTQGKKFTALSADAISDVWLTILEQVFVSPGAVAHRLAFQPTRVAAP